MEDTIDAMKDTNVGAKWDSKHGANVEEKLDTKLGAN
jgi:hypothetical protein